MSLVKTDALDAFAKAMQLSIPDARYESNVTVCSEKACLNRAEILFELGEAEKALEEPCGALEMNVRIVGAYLVAAKALLLLGNLAVLQKFWNLRFRQVLMKRGSGNLPHVFAY